MYITFVCESYWLMVGANVDYVFCTYYLLPLDNPISVARNQTMRCLYVTWRGPMLCCNLRPKHQFILLPFVRAMSTSVSLYILQHPTIAYLWKHRVEDGLIAMQEALFTSRCDVVDLQNFYLIWIDFKTCLKLGNISPTDLVLIW